LYLAFNSSLTAGFMGEFMSMFAALIAVSPTLAQSSPVPGNWIGGLSRVSTG
jgi:hypothetical protein